MTANTRSICNNHPTTRGSQRNNFPRSQNSDNNSFVEESSSKISENEIVSKKYVKEEFSLNSRGPVETPGSFNDQTYGVRPRVFNRVESFDDTNQSDISLAVRNPPTLEIIQARNSNVIIESRRRQGRLLLVSLLEDFCALYDTNPEKNHKLFYVICKSLSAMGIIDEEYIDEVSTVRFTYYRAFKALVVQALNSIKQEQSSTESHMIASSFSKTGASKDGDDLDSIHDVSSRTFRNLTFGDVLDLQNSRYSNDFVETKLLGKGGFASVWKAKNKLDGVDYAIKKIRLRGNKIPGEKTKIFREIKFLARLEHTNVVRYYSSWLEHAYNRQREEPPKFSHENISNTDNSREFQTDSDVSVADSNDDSDIFRMSSLDEESSDDYSGVDFVGGSHSEQSVNVQSRSRDDSSSDHAFKSHQRSSEDWTLFIQMQLCTTTLYDHLKHRDANLSTKKDPLNAINRKISIDLFRGIVHGVTYIHEQGLIHRDLKPGNIFMDVIHETGQGNADSSLLAVERHVPKIGDFGLVTAVYEDHLDLLSEGYTKSKPYNFGSAPEGSSSKSHIISSRSGSSLSYGSRSRTTGVGTVTYASPEQLAKPVKLYNEKADIYSLGIIFFELHFPFSTGHERVQVLKDLRHGILPKEFVQRFPKEAAFILWMIAEDPDQRPDAKQILEFELLAEPIHGEREMHHKLVKSTQVINSMKKENEILRRKISELEEKLSKCECNRTGGSKDATRIRFNEYN